MRTYNVVVWVKSKWHIAVREMEGEKMNEINDAVDLPGIDPRVEKQLTTLQAKISELEGNVLKLTEYLVLHVEREVFSRDSIIKKWSEVTDKWAVERAQNAHR